MADASAHQDATRSPWAPPNSKRIFQNGNEDPTGLLSLTNFVKILHNHGLSTLSWRGRREKQLGDCVPRWTGQIQPGTRATLVETTPLSLHNSVEIAHPFGCTRTQPNTNFLEFPFSNKAPRIPKTTENDTNPCNVCLAVLSGMSFTAGIAVGPLLARRAAKFAGSLLGPTALETSACPKTETHCAIYADDPLDTASQCRFPLREKRRPKRTHYTRERAHTDA